ncbi:single-stranded DNA-binding protein [Mucilaginibacter terrae]|uniref:single-stranded DNA-binding protein n=1 Tax=Mucilaginibacter terrae TaxID=1955052 RepID=UPI00363FF5FB
MWGVNKVVLVGHLGKDPDIRYLAENISVVSFPLATSENITVDGRKVEETEWHNIVMWRSLAEAAYKFLKKGKLIYLEGKIRTRSFDDKQGVQRTITEVLAENFTVLGRSSDFNSADNTAYHSTD